MNRVEELELTVQMLMDRLKESGALAGAYEYNLEMLETSYDNAESILASRPCSCVELPFPHKRTRACFRRY